MPLDRAGNSLRSARKITLKPQKRTIKDWVDSSDQDDYFKFRLKNRSSATFKLTNLKADAQLELLDKRGNMIASSKRQGRKRETIKLDTLKAGKYYVRVHQHQGNTKYKLQFMGQAQDKAPSNNASSANPFIRKVLDLTNGHRRQAGLAPLRLNEKLSSAAQAHSESMAEDDFFSHTGRDGSSPFDRIRSNGYQYKTAAENIAAGYSTPESVVNAWMDSPGHRGNILNGNFREIGIGYHFLDNDPGSVAYNSYWTQSFGTPFR